MSISGMIASPPFRQRGVRVAGLDAGLALGHAAILRVEVQRFGDSRQSAGLVAGLEARLGESLLIARRGWQEYHRFLRVLDRLRQVTAAAGGQPGAIVMEERALRIILAELVDDVGRSAIHLVRVSGAAAFHQ